MKKKKLKIVKSELFKEQEKNLPKEVKDDLKKVLNEIAKNPTTMKGSMSIFDDASPEELKQWMGSVKATTIDLVFEYLFDKNCLSARGRALAEAFWKRYIEKKEIDQKTVHSFSLSSLFDKSEKDAEV